MTNIIIVVVVGNLPPEVAVPADLRVSVPAASHPCEDGCLLRLLGSLPPLGSFLDSELDAMSLLLESALPGCVPPG